MSFLVGAEVFFLDKRHASAQLRIHKATNGENDTKLEMTLFASQN
jgi:hypothetical protein